MVEGPSAGSSNFLERTIAQTEAKKRDGQRERKTLTHSANALFAEN
jgi:hypothetical protein